MLLYKIFYFFLFSNILKLLSSLNPNKNIIVKSQTGLNNSKSVLQPNATTNHLFCYVCQAEFQKDQDLNDPCFFNLTDRDLVKCGDNDLFCQVQRMDSDRVVSKISRSCEGDCQFGCVFNGFGITYKTCTSCCNSRGCNMGNSASIFLFNHNSHLTMHFIMMLMFIFIIF